MIRNDAEEGGGNSFNDRDDIHRLFNGGQSRFGGTT